MFLYEMLMICMMYDDVQKILGLVRCHRSRFFYNIPRVSLSLLFIIFRHSFSFVLICLQRMMFGPMREYGFLLFK